MMHSLITIFSYAAILLALGPLLLLAIYALANRAGWRIADRLSRCSSVSSSFKRLLRA